MKISALWLAASLAIATTACVRTHTNEASGSVDVDVESPTKQGEDWSGNLTGQGMYASVSGKVTALYNEGRTALTVTLSSATPGATFHWDVREGKCGANGAILGNNTSAFTPIMVRNDGTAGATVQLDARLDEAKDYSVTVYAPGNDMRTVVACGDLDD